MNAEKMEKPIEDLIGFFKNTGKPNTSALMEQMGKIVCGKNTFMQLQSSRSMDILAKFTQVGRNPVKDSSNKDQENNDYGSNCKLLFYNLVYHLFKMQ